MAPSFDINPFIDEEAHSDITITFGSKTKKGDKLILCSRSDYFKKLCGPGSSFAESKLDTIDLKDDESEEAVEAMLR